MVLSGSQLVSVRCHLVNVQGGPTIILGIDPGTTIMGYGVVRAWSRNRVELLEMGALHLAKVKGREQHCLLNPGGVTYSCYI